MIDTFFSRAGFGACWTIGRLPFFSLPRQTRSLRSLGGPPGPRSRSKHSLAPIRLHLRGLGGYEIPLTQPLKWLATLMLCLRHICNNTVAPALGCAVRHVMGVASRFNGWIFPDAP
jgi:hypothetical protein